MADPSNLSEPTTAPAADDRRATPRCRCSLDVTCTNSPSALAACLASVRDVSATGIGLVTSQPFPSGATLTVELILEDQVLLSRPLRIKHVRKEGPTSWFLGGSFTTRLSKKEMKLFL